MQQSRVERCATTIALATLLALVGPSAWAQSPEQAQTTELVTLEQDLQEAWESLATSDCRVACLALESMIRAADRICELAPGPRCEAARERVADARQRVRQRCPDCTAAADEEEPVQPSPAPEQQAGADEDAAQPAAAPPAEEVTGGCAACSLGREANAPGAGWLLLLGVAACRRRRRG